MRHIAVTGSTGFLGKWLVSELLKLGAHVTAIVRPGNVFYANQPTHSNLTVVECDMRDSLLLIEKLDGKELNAFYHLAWEGASGIARTDHVIQMANVKVCLDCYHAARTLLCEKFITVGTIGEFMADAALERNVVSENFVYVLSKSFCAKLLKIASNDSPCKALWCTLSNVYGPGNTTGNLINYTIKELLAGNKPTFGPAEQLYDFIHVWDCVRALVAVGEVESPESQYTVSSDNPRQLKEFLLQVRDCINPEFEIGIGERKDDGTFYEKEWFSNEKLKKDTGFLPEYSFQQGIETTLKEFQER